MVHLQQRASLAASGLGHLIPHRLPTVSPAPATASMRPYQADMDMDRKNSFPQMDSLELCLMPVKIWTSGKATGGRRNGIPAAPKFPLVRNIQQVRLPTVQIRIICFYKTYSQIPIDPSQHFLTISSPKSQRRACFGNARRGPASIDLNRLECRVRFTASP